MDAGTALVAVGTAAVTAAAAVLGARYGASATLQAATKAVEAQGKLASDQREHELALDRERRTHERRASTYVAAVRFAQHMCLLTKRWSQAIGAGDSDQISQLQAEGSGEETPTMESQEMLTLDRFRQFMRATDGTREPLMNAYISYNTSQYSEAARFLKAVDNGVADMESTGEAMASLLRAELAPGALLPRDKGG